MEDRRIDNIISELRSLSLQVALLETELNQHEDRAATVLPPTTESRIQRHGYAAGDRIRILYKIKKPATSDNRVEWSEATACKATVTQVKDRQIFPPPTTE
jgi:hypothetical protein